VRQHQGRDQLNEDELMSEEYKASPVIDGEVGELVAWLLDKAEQAANSDSPVVAGMLTWAAQVAGEHADLLERQCPQPIPVSERLPEAGDCDGSLCWQMVPIPDINGRGMMGLWELQHRDWLSDPDGDATHWLPAHALPPPVTEVE
jgi:hypothetical protein